MSTMVTGGTGFVGRRLVETLAADDQSVVSYNRKFVPDGRSQVVSVQGELNDIPRLVSAMSSNGVRTILHTAAMSHPALSIELPITTFAANVEGTLHLFEAARMAGVERIVNFSSESVYGDLEGPIDEHSLLQPTSPYGVTKVATELLGEVYTLRYGLEVISLRITEIYGPGNGMPQFLRDMIQAALAGEPYHLEIGGDHSFHFVHVDDVVNATRLAARCQTPRRRVFNIAGGPQMRLSEAADIVREAIPQADIRVGPGYLAWDRQGPFNIDAAAEGLGYRPSWAPADGIRAYIEHLRANTF